MNDALQSGLIAGASCAVIFRVLTEVRRPSKTIAGMPEGRDAFAVNAPHSEVLNSVGKYVAVNSLKLEHSDPTAGFFVLGANMNLLKNHFGYWVYIHVTEHQTGNAVVDVAIESRLFRTDLNLRKYCDQVGRGLRAAMAAEGKQLLDAGTLLPLL